MAPQIGSVLVGPLEKRVFSSLWPCHCFFLIFVARVSGVTLLAGSVAKKKKLWKEDPELEKFTQKLDFRTYFFT